MYLRDGNAIHVLANEVVPGDIVTFSTGDRIPADVRLISAVDLEIDESSLTGETTARRKDTDSCRAQNGNAHAGHVHSTGGTVALADRTCIAYMGTLVRNGEMLRFKMRNSELIHAIYFRTGRGSGVVIAIGTQTEFGVIFSMMQDVSQQARSASSL